MSPFDIVTSIYMCLVSLATVFGNGLVILTWIFHKPIRSPGNLYLVSLASVDLITGLCQMPFLIGYKISGKWPFGTLSCFLYIFNGWVLISASIFHIMAIAIDRYQVIYDGVSYIQRRTLKSVMLRIVFIWIFSIWQMLPRIFPSDEISNTLEATRECASVPDIGSRFHLCFGVYYFPVIVTAIIYRGVYNEIRRILADKSLGRVVPISNNDTKLVQQKPEDKKVFKLVRNIFEKKSSSVSDSDSTRSNMTEITMADADENNSPPSKGNHAPRRISYEGDNIIQKQRHTAKILGIVMGAFIFSWMPFFLMYPTIGLLPEAYKPHPGVFVWVLAIGFSNSAMNPIIYTFYNQEFRVGFRKILPFVCWS